MDDAGTQVCDEKAEGRGWTVEDALRTQKLLAGEVFKDRNMYTLEKDIPEDCRSWEDVEEKNVEVTQKRRGG